MEEIKANQDKNLEIEVDGQKYLRLPLKTHVLLAEKRLSMLPRNMPGRIKKPVTFFLLANVL